MLSKYKRQFLFKTEQFKVLKSTSGNASVRQFLGRPGELWLPESGTDKLVVILE